MEEMKLVRADFNHLHLPMAEDSTHMLYLTTRVLALAAATSDQTVRDIGRYHAAELPELTAGYPAVRNEFLDLVRRHRVEFAQPRVRQNFVFWSLPDATYALSHIKTSAARDFRNTIVRIALDNVRRSLVTMEQYMALQHRLEARIEELSSQIRDAQPALDAVAAGHGRGLQAQKYVKALRLVKL